MTTLEIIVCILLGGLWVLSIWLNRRYTKLQIKADQQQKELRKELDRLDRNLATLHSDLRQIFPTHQFSEN